MSRLVCLVLLSVLGSSAFADQLVFGSFQRQDNAVNWAARLNTLLHEPVHVERFTNNGTDFYRVLTQPLDAARQQQLRQRARLEGLDVWRLVDGRLVDVPPVEVAQDPPTQVQTPVRTEPVRRRTAETARIEPASPVLPEQSASSSRRSELDWDVAIQGRSFADDGLSGQDQLEGSVSLQLEYYLGWEDERQSITFSPFARYDSADSRRTHADVRELFYTLVGSNWDLHVGAKKVFWGVTEFHHLVDIVNQTDLVENIDGEDKLGQPMVQASFVGDWGLLDLYALVGFRERTFPGLDGRLRHPLLISSDAAYESAAGRNHVDAALRWSHTLGALEFGLHHFSGTSRDPLFNPLPLPGGEFKLQPYYPQIDQSGVDAQAIFGEWVFKLEGIHRSGFGPSSYSAANLGLERTFFAVAGTAADVGLVLEYMYDERGDDAINTLFENDLVIGGRFSFNNLADTQLLVGLITDLDTDEMIFSVEGSHRIGDDWLVSLEGRGFAGGETYRSADMFRSLTERELKSAWLQDEDYFQLEIKKFF